MNIKTNKLEKIIQIYKETPEIIHEHRRGWDKIAIKTFEKILWHLKRNNPFENQCEKWTLDDCEFEIGQIKQKLGFLDIVVYPWDERILQIIDDARDESMHTCEICGISKGTRLSVSGWMVTLCDPCKKEVDCKGL